MSYGETDNENHMQMLNIHHSVPYSDRLERLRDYWTTLPYILPTEAGHKWLKAAAILDLDDSQTDSESMMRWLYEIQQAIEPNGESFDNLMQRISQYASGCARTTGGKKTCRTMNGGAAKKLETRPSKK